MSKPLWDHQVEAIKVAEKTPNLFLGMEMGTGKTRTAIEIARRRYAHEKRLMKTLIICPIIVCDNWKKEWQMFSKIQNHDLVVLTKSGKRRKKDFLDAVGDTLERPKIVITNYQALLMDDLYSMIMDWGPELIIFDESHRVKNPNSKTAKKAMALADLAKQKLMLTGTPILNSSMDLWMQFRILDGGQTFGKNFFAFRAMYFKDSNSGWSSKPGYFPKWEPTVETYEQIQNRIKNKMIRVLKEDCLDLPPLVKQDYYVELSPEQARMYVQMRDEYLAFVESIKASHPVTVTAQLAITKALRLQQIVSGYASTEQAGTLWIKDNPRLAALEELLEDITPAHKVIVWAVFKENYKMIADLCDKMGIEWTEIHGDISTKQKIENMNTFRTKDSCRVMISNQQAGGTGINLVEASYSIYYSKGFSLEHALQSEARNHRGGSEMHKKITHINLIAKDTIDELVNEALAAKQDISNKILTWEL